MIKKTSLPVNKMLLTTGRNTKLCILKVVQSYLTFYIDFIQNKYLTDDSCV
jgi:hypothetical protein